MPGPVSDSYDPEWSTGHNAGLISDALIAIHAKLSEILGGKPPMCILNLVGDGDNACARRAKMKQAPITATLSEYEWRILRFAAERAHDGI